MPTEESVEKIEAETSETIKGKVRVLGKGWANPTPTKLANITKALRYFMVGCITMVSGSDLFSGGQAKIINFCLGVGILFLGAVDLGVGVEPDKKQVIGSILILAWGSYWAFI